ncbi:hypothetical protein PFISCL1PPCAC_26910, partial [Pristionchus fissidentatus]
KGYSHWALNEYINWNAITPRNHNMPIPRILFYKLDWILKRHTYYGLKFVNVLIDATFLYHISTVFRPDTSRISIAFDEAVVDESLTNRELAQLGNLMISLRTHNIHVIKTPLEGRKVFGELFIRNLVRGSIHKNFSLKMMSRIEDADPVRFEPLKSIIHCLAKFHTFHLLSLTMNTDFLVEALMLRMDMEYSTGEWKFCVSSQINRLVHLSNGSVKGAGNNARFFYTENIEDRPPNYIGNAEYTFCPQTKRHEIRRKDNNNYAGFYVSAYRPRIYVVEVKFYHDVYKKFPEKCDRIPDVQ